MLLKDLLDVLKEYEDQACLLNVRLELKDMYKGYVVGVDRSDVEITKTDVNEIVLSQVTDDVDFS